MKTRYEIDNQDNQVRWIWSDGDGGFIFLYQGSSTTSKVTKDGKIINDWTPHRDGERVRGIAKADETNLWAIYSDNKLYKLDKDGLSEVLYSLRLQETPYWNIWRAIKSGVKK